MSSTFIQYTYLQVLDFLTTVAFLLHGVREANPVVRWFIDSSTSPLHGLVTVKLLALALGLAVWMMGKRRLLATMNVLFALLVAWNLLALIVAGMAPQAMGQPS
ncbi:MAG: hypothetical protein KIT09_18500 [Bryobacteraceae bacterium]|nr:hypothetical protein [Bryobacteraceae bacterium]